MIKSEVNRKRKWILRIIEQKESLDTLVQIQNDEDLLKKRDI